MRTKIRGLCALALLAWGVNIRSAAAAAPAAAPDRGTAHQQEQLQLWKERAESAQIYIGRVEEILPEGLVVDCGTEETNSSWFSKFLSGYPRFAEYSPGDRIKFRAFRDGSHYFKSADGTSRALMKFTYCEETSVEKPAATSPTSDEKPEARNQPDRLAPRNPAPEDVVVW